MENEAKQDAPAPDMGIRQPVGIDPLYLEDAPAFPPDVVAKLAARVPGDRVEIKTVTDRDGRIKSELVYLPWMMYQEVLFSAFGVGGYRMVPTGQPKTVGNVKTWPGALFVRIPGERKFQFVKSATGECQQHASMTEGNAIEGAQSDCLVKCCKGIGIFSELFDPNWRRDWETNHKADRKAEIKAPPKAVAEPAVSQASGVIGPFPGPATAVVTGAFPNAKVVDTGEAASKDAFDAIRGLVKKLTWKPAFARMWLEQRFGLKQLEAATARQAENAYLLLSAEAAGNKELYNKLLAEMVAGGEARP